MSFRSWRDHFERSRLRPMPDLRGGAAQLPPAWRKPLARSLAVFQLGESRGGRLAVEIDEVPGLDDDYREAIKRFVAEEQRHGAVLALCVEELGGELLAHTWTETLFVAARRVLGVRFKLVVLLAAETVGLAFYRAVASRLPAGPVRAALDEICADEVHHLRFHADAFGGRLGFRLVWYPVVTAAGAVVLVDHRAALRAIGVPWREAVTRFATQVRAMGRALGRERDTPIRDGESEDSREDVRETSEVAQAGR